MKKNKIILAISMFLIIFALIGTLFLDDAMGNKISNIVTVITAIIGAVALFIQFKKDKELNQASFVLEFSKTFYNDYDCVDIMNELDSYLSDPEKFDYEKYKKSIVPYMQWIESLAALVENKTLTLDKIENVLDYRFFIIVNNPVVQKNEIVPFKDFYRGTYKLYDKWYNYKKARGIKIPLEEYSLHKTEGYKDNL